MTNEKWYNSKFANYLGEGLAIAAICIGLGYGCRACNINPVSELEMKKEIEIEKIKAKQLLQHADINGNGILDKFYVIDGKIAVVELDGKPIVNSLDTKILEKNK